MGLILLRLKIPMIGCGMVLAAMALTACGGGGSSSSGGGGGEPVTTSNINLPTSVQVVAPN